MLRKDFVNGLLVGTVRPCCQFILLKLSAGIPLRNQGGGNLPSMGSLDLSADNFHQPDGWLFYYVQEESAASAGSASNIHGPFGFRNWQTSKRIKEWE